MSYTLFIAHPDDEILWFWPFLPLATRIVCMVSDRHNQERAWCRERGECLKEVGRMVGAEVINLDLNSEFYRLPTRGGELKAVAEEAMNFLSGNVATHNSWGEYGHLDHILCHQIAMFSGWPVYVTDICQEVNWLPVRPERFDGSVETIMERALFNKVKAIYDRRGCWTWSHEPVERCGVVRVQ